MSDRPTDKAKGRFEIATRRAGEANRLISYLQRGNNPPPLDDRQRGEAALANAVENIAWGLTSLSWTHGTRAMRMRDHDKEDAMGSLADEIEHTDEIEKQPEAHLREHGMDIAVVDDGDANGWLSPATGVCEIHMSDVKSMVANVLEKKGPYQIRRLDVIDHGNDHSFLIGDDWISPDTLEKFRPELSKLKGHFSASGFVHLRHCDIAMNRELLVALAKMWGVSVYAGTGDHRSDIRSQSGRYVRADPNGSVRPAGRPGEDSLPGMLGEVLQPLCG